MVKRLNNGFIVEDQTIVVSAVLNETDLGTTEAANGYNTVALPIIGLNNPKKCYRA